MSGVLMELHLQTRQPTKHWCAKQMEYGRQMEASTVQVIICLYDLSLTTSRRLDKINIFSPLHDCNVGWASSQLYYGVGFLSLKTTIN